MSIIGLGTLKIFKFFLSYLLYTSSVLIFLHFKNFSQKVYESFCIVILSFYVIFNTVNIMKLLAEEGECERTVVKYFCSLLQCIILILFSLKVFLPHHGIKIYFLSYPDSPMSTHCFLHTDTPKLFLVTI